jgi:hypothetical protein
MCISGPATVVAAGMHLCRRSNQSATEEARPFLPAMREAVKELEKYPNVELVDVTDRRDRVRVAMVDGNCGLMRSTRMGMW